MFQFSEQAHLKSGLQQEEQRVEEETKHRFIPAVPIPWGFPKEYFF
jgi:hypothetical protein